MARVWLCVAELLFIPFRYDMICISLILPLMSSKVLVSQQRCNSPTRKEPRVSEEVVANHHSPIYGDLELF